MKSSTTLHIFGIVFIFLTFASGTLELSRYALLLAVLFFCSGAICRTLESLADILSRSTTEKQSETVHEWHKESEEG